MGSSIRPANSRDSARLQSIESAAGLRFVDVGMPEIAADPPLPRETLDSYADRGRSWVALGDHDNPVGYILVQLVDGATHIQQLSVHPDHQGLGWGRKLIDSVEAWSRCAGIPSMTLTTFDQVPWNRPLYEHLRFSIIPAGEIGPELSALLVQETEAGLRPEIRVCMRRTVSPAP